MHQSTPAAPRGFATLSALAVALLVWTGAILGAPTSGTCATPDISGVWTASQSNVPGVPIIYTFTQSGTAIRGSARYLSYSATVTGTLVGGRLDIRSTYNNGVVSQHTATVTATSMTGTGYAVSDPSGTAVTWTATGTARCELPVPGPDLATGRMQSIKPAGKGGVTSVVVVRGGVEYTASENSVLQTGDVIRTDKNTILAIEFLIGGRVGVNKDTEVVMVNERAVADGRLSLKRLILKNGSLWIKADARALKEPIEIQTNGGTMGIRG